MSGPGMFVSDGKDWRPAKVKIRLGHTDKNDVTPPKYLIDPTTGKEVEQFDPAAVDSIKKTLGLGEKDPIELDKLKVEVAHYDAENEKASLAKSIDKLVDVVASMQESKTGGDKGRTVPPSTTHDPNRP